MTGEDTLNSGIYDKIFSGDVDCNNLEAVYRMFNTDHPAGYTGRSLSVSDVVEITDGDKKGFYFCDNIGFQKIDFDSSLCKDMTATEKLSVLLIQPGKAPRMVEILDTLDAMQELVGGYIEEYMPFDDEVAIDSLCAIGAVYLDIALVAGLVLDIPFARVLGKMNFHFVLDIVCPLPQKCGRGCGYIVLL